MLKPNDNLGPYKLVRLIGDGSFGIVWLAQDLEQENLVALKLAKSANPDEVRKEATTWERAVGHRNILPILHTDVYDGHIVIVSEYAPNGSLEDWLKKHGGKAPSTALAVGMISQILSGLAHLHSRQIIHRDLKPGNILFKGKTPCIADFGIAKVLTSGSQSNLIKGTPHYMAPEVFNGDRSEQTDIWSAGVIFHLLLVGSLPFRHGIDFPELMKIVKTEEQEPLPLTVPQALRQVVQRALQKEPQKRFQSAKEMLEELKGLDALRSMPAAEASMVEDEIPTVVRNPRARQSAPAPQPAEHLPRPAERRQAKPRERVTPRTFSNSPASVLASIMRWQVSKWLLIALFAILVVLPVVYFISVHLTGQQAKPEAKPVESKLTGSTKPIEGPIGDFIHNTPVVSILFSPDGNTLVTVAGSVEYGWDIPSNKVAWRGENKRSIAGAYSPDRKTYADIEPLNQSGRNDPYRDVINLWGTTTNNRKRQLMGHRGRILAIAFSPDGEYLLSVDATGEFKRWDTHTGDLVQAPVISEHRVPSVAPPDANEKAAVSAAGFSSDGTQLVKGLEDGTILVMNLKTRIQKIWKGHKKKIYSIAFSPNGNALASGSDDETLKLWDAQMGVLKHTLREHTEKVLAVTFSPDSRFLASGSADHTVKLWEVTNGYMRQTLTGHNGGVLAIRFSPDGKTLASGCEDGLARLWNVSHLYEP